MKQFLDMEDGHIMLLYIQGQHDSVAFLFAVFIQCTMDPLEHSIFCRLVREELMISSYELWHHTVVHISFT